jgi:hypothetical protein
MTVTSSSNEIFSYQLGNRAVVMGVDTSAGFCIYI